MGSSRHRSLHLPPTFHPNMGRMRGRFHGRHSSYFAHVGPRYAERTAVTFPYDGSVVLADVAVRLVEQLLVSVELVLQQRAASSFCTRRSPWLVCCQSGKRTFFTMSSMSATMRSTMMWVFPALRLREKLRQGFLRSIALFLRVGLLLRLDDVLRDFEDRLQKLQAGEESLLVAFLDPLQPLAQRGELRIAEVLAQARDQLDLDLAAPSCRARRP